MLTHECFLQWQVLVLTLELDVSYSLICLLIPRGFVARIRYCMESLTIKPPQWWLASPTGWWPLWMRHRVMVEHWGTPNTDKTLFPWVGVIENIAKRHFLPQNLNIDILFGSLYSWKLFILLNIKCTWHEQGFVMKPYHSSSLSRSTASLSENWTSISMSSASASSSSCLFNFWSGKVLT